jgi:hypothetical protein
MDDAVEPTRQFQAVIEFIQVLPNLYESLLKDIIGFIIRTVGNSDNITFELIGITLIQAGKIINVFKRHIDNVSVRQLIAILDFKSH